MVTYSEYYELVSMGLKALQEKLAEAQAFTLQQHSAAVEREQSAATNQPRTTEQVEKKEKPSTTRKTTTKEGN